MRHTNSYEKWTSPTMEMDRDFHRLSYALYADDDEPGYVLAARTPEPKRLGIGDDLFGRLPLPKSEWDYVRDNLYRPAPRFVLTDLGLGILFKHYEPHAGMGLYWHIHCRPDAGARLLNSGALGAPGETTFSVSDAVRAMGDTLTKPDEVSFAALAEAWDTVRRFQRGLLFVNQESLLDVQELARVIEYLAAFAGCRVDVTLANDPSPWARKIKCYRPLMLEAMLLYLMTEVQEYAVDRHAICEISSIGRMDGGNLSMTLRYPVDTRTMTPLRREVLSNARDYLNIVCEPADLDVYYELPPTVEEKTAPLPGHRRRQSPIAELEFALDWMADPSVLLSSDFKACLKLRYK